MRWLRGCITWMLPRWARDELAWYDRRIAALQSDVAEFVIASWLPAAGHCGYDYPVTKPAPTPATTDWTGTDAEGYASTALDARVRRVGKDAWCVRLGGEWITDGRGPAVFPTAAMAKEQAELRRKAQSGADLR